MTAISVTFSPKVVADWDPQKPLTTTKLNGLVDNTTHVREWLGASYYAGAAQDHNHDGINSALVPVGPNYLRNGSFETDTSGGTITQYTGGTVQRVTSTSLDGLASLAFTSTVLANGGGEWVSDEFVPVTEGRSYPLSFAIKASVANVSSKAEIRWYDNTKSLISSSTIYSSSSTPTLLTVAELSAVAPAGARFMKVKITGGVPATGTATGTIYFDGILLGKVTVHLCSVGPGTNYKAVPGWYGTAMTAMSASFVEVGNCLIVRGGTVRVSLSCNFVGGNPTSNVQIYKNGAAFGTNTAFNNSTVDGTEVYNEDLTFSEGDFVQVFVHGTNTSYVAGVKKWKMGTDTAGFAVAVNAAIGDR